MHKKTNITITKWEWHFQKLQHGLILDENNSDLIETTKNENCNKKLRQNDAGSSHDKSYDKHKVHSLDECAKNIIKKLREIPGHIYNDKSGKKTLNDRKHIDAGKSFYETNNTKKKTRNIKNFKTCAFASKNTLGIRIMRMSQI